MTGDAVHANVASEPQEAAGPSAQRKRDLIRENALHLGHITASQEGGVPIRFDAFRAGVEAYELYKAVHDRRHHSALEDVR